MSPYAKKSFLTFLSILVSTFGFAVPSSADSSAAQPRLLHSISGVSEPELPSKSTKVIQQSSIPEFAAYSANSAYTGKPAAANLKTKRHKDHQAVLTSAINSPADFAGEFVLATWGGGTGCIDGAVVSLKSGDVYDLPNGICDMSGNDEELIDYRADSRLLVINGITNKQKHYGRHYFEFTGTDFTYVLSVLQAD